MDDQKVAVFLGMVNEIYGIKTSEPKILIELWHKYLCDEPEVLVQQAFDEWIAKEKWAPKPSEILEIIEHKKGALWAESISIDPFGEQRKELPDEFKPRWVTRRPKQFQIGNRAQITKEITAGGGIGNYEILPELQLSPGKDKKS